MNKRVLAFDFGASTGRAIIGEFDGEKISIHEVHRFNNDPVTINGTVYWDVQRLFFEIKQGILKAKEDGGFDSIGIDTWGVDFGLLRKDGTLVENPIHYRDKRNDGMVKLSEKYMSNSELYSITGIQFMDFNTVFQLLSLKENRPYILEEADTLLFMPDLFNYMLTGVKSTEYSIATTSQLVDLNTKTWSDEVIESFGFNRDLFTKIVPAGTVVGQLSDEICEELGVPKADVIAVCAHDTQSAVTSSPTDSDDFIFVSSGTWSLIGSEIPTPITNEKARSFNVTNEGGYGFSTAFLKNVCGLWLIQESRRQWKRDGKEYSYADLEKLALECEPFKCFIDPDAPEFGVMGNLPKRIQEYCKKTNQYVPETVGEIMRCIYESLALKYRVTFDGIKDCTNKEYDRIHIMGGGTKDKLLLNMASQSCNVNVYGGPIEATALGNIAVQLLSSGVVKSIKEVRKIIAKGENLSLYKPENAAEWVEPYERFKKILGAAL
ncbi:MAG: rhamnulokinase [Oscillospiraceae bacterium]|nr:rhamnulokinase [Oscillospiraceae bacterium]